MDTFTEVVVETRFRPGSILHDAVTLTGRTGRGRAIRIEGQILSMCPTKIPFPGGATFVNEGGLEAIGDNLYLESGSSGAPNLSVPGVDGTGVLLQGYTEASNVDAVSEVTALIVAQRAYEMNSKVITAADQMLSTANQVKS
jgi:hypothetical protein